MSSNPGIGEIVVYYEKGDEGNAEPYVGIITRVFHNGSVTIYLFPTQGGFLDPAFSHRSPVFHRDHPVLEADKERKVIEGSWEYPKLHNRRVAERKEAERIAKQELHDRMYRTGKYADEDVVTTTMRKTILNLVAEGKDAVAISKHTKTKKAIVEQVIAEAEVVA